VAGLRYEYSSITDTWDESNMTLDNAKTDLKVKALRVEQRMARERNGKSAGFQASTTPSSMSMEQLQRRVAELKGMVTSNKASTFGSGGSRVIPRQHGGRVFKGICYGCGERGHCRSECAKRLSPHQSANQADASRTVDKVNNQSIFLISYASGSGQMWFDTTNSPHIMLSTRFLRKQLHLSWPRPLLPATAVPFQHHKGHTHGGVQTTEHLIT
jgi:hypothetical protein